MHWIYLIHEFHNLSWITEINELFQDILIYFIYYSLYRYIYTVHIAAAKNGKRRIRTQVARVKEHVPTYLRHWNCSEMSIFYSVDYPNHT